MQNKINIFTKLINFINQKSAIKRDNKQIHMKETRNTKSSKMKENIKTIEQEPSHLLNLEIYGRVLFYVLAVGFIYNYSFFNLGLNFNIFDFLQPSDFLFSWLNSTSLLVSVSILSLMYLISAFNKNISISLSCIFIIISVIFFILNFYSEFFLFNFFKNLKNSYNEIWTSLFMFFSFLIAFAFLTIFKKIKDNFNILNIEIILVLGLFSHTIISAFTEKQKIINTPQKVLIAYKNNTTNREYTNQELYYIGKISSTTILAEIQTTANANEIKSFITINNDDISSLKFQIDTTNIGKKSN